MIKSTYCKKKIQQKEIARIKIYQTNNNLKYTYKELDDGCLHFFNIRNRTDLQLLGKIIDTINYEIEPIKTGISFISGKLIEVYNGAKIIPLNGNSFEVFVDKLNSEYMLKGELVEREDAIAYIEMSESSYDLFELEFKNDSSLMNFITKKYPNIKSTYGKKNQ